MKKLLRNKVVAGGLCGVAVLFVAGNFVRLPGHGPVPVAARAPSAPPGETEAVTFNIPPPLRIRSELDGWRELFPSTALRRDPFALPSGKSPTAVSTNPPSFTLYAVSIEPGRALAVINQSVVAVGERLGNCVVEKILPTEVWLTSTFGRVVVRIGGIDAIRHKTP